MRVDDVREAIGRVERKFFEQLIAAHERHAAVLVRGVESENERIHRARP
jgi:hypothetical protein